MSYSGPASIIITTEEAKLLERLLRNNANEANKRLREKITILLVARGEEPLSPAPEVPKERYYS
jgi:hypothetical protein